MGDVKLYRKRVIPEECLLLDKDVILYRDPEVIITKWDTIHPKKTLHHGYSCYFIDRGFKVSKFYDHDGNLISWYCDIICHTYDPETETYVFTDLLADVIVYPDGFVRVVDLDELADAFRDRLITAEQMQMALRRLDKLLNGSFLPTPDTRSSRAAAPVAVRSLRHARGPLPQGCPGSLPVRSSRRRPEAGCR